MDPVNLFDMEKSAKLRMSHNYWDWVAGGAADEITIRRNRESFEEISIRTRVLVDTSNQDMSTTMLGQPVRFPIFASPTWSQWLAHPDGEVAVAAATGSLGTLMAVATAAHKTVEEVVAATAGPVWFQLYHFADALTEYMLPKAESAGCSAICLTVGGAGGKVKERDLRNHYVPSSELAWGDLKSEPDLIKQFEGLDRFAYHGLTWERIEWLRGLTSLPLVIKEVLTPEDARRCIDHGASAIIVSNHGGRSFDTQQSTIEVLPAIVEEVGDEVEIYMDSGIRRGADVLKALALGARAVGVGRPLFWGLAIDGEAGVTRMFEILRGEFSRAMAMCGCKSLQDIDSSLVVLPSQR